VNHNLKRFLAERVTDFNLVYMYVVTKMLCTIIVSPQFQLLAIT